MLEKNFYFIHIPKTGGSSISQALSWQCDPYHKHHTLSDCLDGISCNHKRKLVPISLDFFQTNFSFTVIRNPWQRLISCYFWWNIDNSDKESNQKINKQNFTKWILNGAYFEWRDYKRPWLLQSDWYLDDRTQLTKIYKLNELNKYWNEICDNTIKRQTHLPHIGQTNHIDYKYYYVPKTKKIVNKMCEQDIDLHKWTF